MRQLMSQQRKLTPVSPTIQPTDQSTTTPTVQNPTTGSFSTPGSPASLSTPSSSPQGASTLTDDVTPHRELAEENERLREKIVELNNQVRVLLDHSIESDTRLLQFTDQVFAANTPGSTPVSTTRPCRIDCAPVTVDCAVQCEPLPPLDSREGPVYSARTTHTSVQCDLRELRTICDSKKCAEERELISNLKTTIEVLEAEVNCLALERAKCQCRHTANKETWTEVKVKRKSRPVETKNKFELLRKKMSKEPASEPTSQPTIKQVNNKKRHAEQNIQNKKRKREAVGFNTVCIRGDSHARHIAALVGSLVDSSVTGFCKPGAKLCNVISPGAATRGQHCEVLIAGTNDVASGDQYNIYHRLERHITSRPEGASIVIATLPYRHDLPADDDINQETALVNAYIEEVAARHNAHILDFNLIKRRMFTRHGMHLTQQGKQQLARLIVRSLVKAGGIDRRASHLLSQKTPPSSTPVCDPGVLIPRPVEIASPGMLTASNATQCLPHETFADALKAKTMDIRNVTKNEGPPRNVTIEIR